MPVWLKTTLRDGASFRRLTKLLTPALKLRAKYCHIDLYCLSAKANL